MKQTHSKEELPLTLDSFIPAELCSQSYHLFDPPKPVNERMDIYGPENLHLPQRYTEQSLSKFTVEQVYHLYDCEDYLRKNLSALDPEVMSALMAYSSMNL